MSEPLRKQCPGPKIEAGIKTQCLGTGPGT